MSERFEELIADLLIKMGYNDVERVGRVGDRGVDVTAYREDEFGHRWKYIVQCKFYEEGFVSSPEMQQFVGALQIHGADRGLFVTSSSFTNEATEIAETNDITLIDKELLENFLSKYDIIEKPSKKRRKKRVIITDKPMGPNQLYSRMSFGKKVQEFIIPNIEPLAVLNAFNIVLENNLMINLEEINLVDAKIKTRGLFVVNWNVNKVWHDSQGRVRDVWRGQGVYITEEKGKVIHDVGSTRKGVISKLADYVDLPIHPKWRELCDKFDVYFPKVKRIPYKRRINIRRIPKNDVYCDPRKVYIAKELSLEYRYHDKECFFSVNCFTGEVTHKIPSFSKSEARREAVRFKPELEFMTLATSEVPEKWIFNSKEDPHLHIQVHKNSGKVITDKTPSELVIEAANKKAKSIFEDAKYQDNLVLNITIGKNCSARWTADFSSKNGDLNILSNLKGEITVRKKINKKHAQELAISKLPATAKSLSARVRKNNYYFDCQDDEFYWELLVDFEGNVEIIRKNLLWEAALNRATDKLTEEGVFDAELVTPPTEEILKSYVFDYESPLNGLFKIQVSYNTKEDFCDITQQNITKHRAAFIAEKYANGKVLSIKRRFFGFGNSWNIKLDCGEGDVRQVSVDTKGDIKDIN